MPPLRDLAAAVRRLAEYPTATRLGLELDYDGGRWRYATNRDAWAESSVRVLDAAAAAPVDEVITRVATLARGGPAVSFWIAGDRMCVAADHGLGDGHFLRTAAAVIDTAYTGRVPDWAHRPAYPNPLRAALWRHFGRHPLRVVDLVRYVRAQRTLPSVEQPGPSLGEWTASPTVRTVASAPDVLEKLKAWREQQLPGVSSAALVIGAAEVALQKLGVRTTAAPLVLFSLRRYLDDRGADVAGNFSFGVRVPEAATGDPRHVHTALNRAADLGRPVAALGLAALRRGGEGAPSNISGTWDVAHSYLGRPRDLEGLRWLTSDAPPYGAFAVPGGPTGVTIVYSEVRGRLGASVSFHSSVVETAMVDRFLELLCGDPVALLEERNGA